MSGEKSKGSGLKIMIVVMLAVIVALVVIIAKISTDKPSDPSKIVINSTTDPHAGVMTALPRTTEDEPATDDPGNEDPTDAPVTEQAGEKPTAIVTAVPVTPTPTQSPTEKPTGDLKLVD